MASKKSKQQKQEKIRQLKLRQKICNILFLLDTVLVLLLALFSKEDMTAVWVVLTVVAAGFFLISNSTKQELAALDPQSVKGPTDLRKQK